MSYSKISKRGKRVIISWVVVAVIFFGFGLGVGFICDHDECEKPHIEPTAEATPVIILKVTPTAEPTVEPTPEPTAEPTLTNLGTFRITAYCACDECCGRWAENRPLDENGKPIVYTSSGAIAKQGVTVAADTDVLPFGTVLLIDGHEYIVQDRGSAIKGNRIDIFYSSHESATEHGVQYKDVYVKGGV